MVRLALMQPPLAYPLAGLAQIAARRSMAASRTSRGVSMAMICSASRRQKTRPSCSFRSLGPQRRGGRLRAPRTPCWDPTASSRSPMGKALTLRHSRSSTTCYPRASCRWRGRCGCSPRVAMARSPLLALAGWQFGGRESGASLGMRGRSASCALMPSLGWATRSPSRRGARPPMARAHTSCACTLVITSMRAAACCACQYQQHRSQWRPTPQGDFSCLLCLPRMTSLRSLCAFMRWPSRASSALQLKSLRVPRSRSCPALRWMAARTRWRARTSCRTPCRAGSGRKHLRGRRLGNQRSGRMYLPSRSHRSQKLCRAPGPLSARVWHWVIFRLTQRLRRMAAFPSPLTALRCGRAVCSLRSVWRMGARDRSRRRWRACGCLMEACCHACMAQRGSVRTS
mmetsp:Transcript_195/g.834  ORF Transcript_195/g.834 Transcript_195/m.834 type:complete len:399 (-) Transcript_195:1426-2622(-)